MATKLSGSFEWDEDKEKLNIKKHGLSFEEILPIFDDPMFAEKADLEHSTLEEPRFIGMGKINGTVVIVSCYTPKEERIRIINARISTKREAKIYEEWCKRFYG